MVLYQSKRKKTVFLSIKLFQTILTSQTNLVNWQEARQGCASISLKYGAS